MKNLALIIQFIFCFYLGYSQNNTITLGGNYYVEVWGDEFNSTTPNYSNWKSEPAHASYLSSPLPIPSGYWFINKSYNTNLWDSDNYVLTGNSIKFFVKSENITARVIDHEPNNYDLASADPNRYEPNLRSFDYTSGSIVSRKKFGSNSVMHIRFKSAKGYGMWPHFWTFGSYDGLFLCGTDVANSKNYSYANEIDGFELFPHSRNTLTSNAHFWHSVVAGGATTDNFISFQISKNSNSQPYNLDEEWTELIIEWRENDILYWIKPSVDCHVYNLIQLPANQFTLYKTLHNENNNPNYDPKYELQSNLILGLCIGGIGYPNFPSGSNGTPTDISVPLEVDFVRVYSKLDNTLDLNLCAFYQTPNQPSFRLAENIILGGDGCAGALIESHATINGVNTVQYIDDVDPYPDQTYTGQISWYNYPFADDLTAYATQSIILKPGFLAEANSKFKAAIIDNNGNQIRTFYQDETDFLTEIITNGEESSQTIKIYPNPNNGKFTLETNIGNIDLISIYDLNGKTLFQEQAINNSSSIDLEFLKLRPGLYFIVVKSGDHYLHSKFSIF